MTKADYTKAYGTWEVTTEGDCEGRSTRRLGTFEGFLDEIAFALADKSYYRLCFKRVGTQVPKTKTGTSVNVALDIDSGTWNMLPTARIDLMKSLLKGRDVLVTEGTSFAAVTLHDGSSHEAREAKEKELKRSLALAKLSAEDKKALGLS